MYSNYVDGGVAWFDEGEEGACVGQECRDGVKKLTERLAKATHKDELEYLRVEIAALQHARASRSGEFEISTSRGEIRAESRKGQGELMRVCKAALQVANPMPDWALTATAAGWKPPKGWKP